MDAPESSSPAHPTSQPSPAPSTSDIGAPSSLEEGFVAVASTRTLAPPVAPIRRWKVVLAIVAAVAAVLGTIAFFVDAAGRIRADRSMDVPFPGGRRLGLYGTTKFTRWVCSEGHEHWSAPYGAGAFVAVLVTVLLVSLAIRLARRPRA